MIEALLSSAHKKKELKFGPGPQELVFGNETVGFFGEFPASEFITGSELASLVGLTSGTLYNNTSPWLKFYLDGEIVYVPKSTLRYSLSWNSINSANAVDSTKIVTFQDHAFSIGLLKGADTDPSVNNSGDYVTGSHNSEWSRLLYPLVKDDPHIPANVKNPLAPYTNVQLGLLGSSGTGSFTWCREVHGAGPSYRVGRGVSSVASILGSSSAGTSFTTGWRPRLGLKL